jgi:uncharacterized repeat protein (TIGR03943 family)
VLLAAGAVLVAVAVLSLVQAMRSRATAAEPADQPTDEHGHEHRHGRFDVAWLLVLPMLVVLVVAPRALGSYSAGRAGTALGAAQTSDFVPLPAGDPVRVSLLDYASRAVFDHGVSLTGRHLVLSGFVLPGAHGDWYLTRMVITCCAADAQPIKVGLSGTVPPGLRANDWVEVTGSYTTRTAVDAVNAETIPFVQVATSRPIPAPAEQYVS